MSEKKRWGDKIVGWFVEREGAGSASTQHSTTEAAQPQGETPPPGPVQLKGEVPPAPEPGGTLDFAAVYRAAGISEEAQDRADKAITMLQTLPAEAPEAVKRQIVEASLKAFGYPMEQIVEAAVTEIKALQAFIALGERNTQKLVAESDERVEALTREIAKIKDNMEQKLSAQGRLTEHCARQQDRVEQVLAFFGREASDDAPREPAPPEEPAADKEKSEDEQPADGE